MWHIVGIAIGLAVSFSVGVILGGCLCIGSKYDAHKFDEERNSSFGGFDDLQG